MVDLLPKGVTTNHKTYGRSESFLSAAASQLCSVILLGILASFALTGYFAHAATQQIGLRAGWNLISIQVGDPIAGFSVEAVRSALDRPNELGAIWAYHPTERTYTSFQSDPSYPSDLFSIRPGPGYWIKVTNDAVLTLSGPVWNGGLDLVTGWNLVGFPGLQQAEDESLILSTVFRDRFGSVPQIWTYEPGSSLFGGQRYVGYDTTSRPSIEQLKTIHSGRGYWVYASESISVEAGPVLALPPDADIEPLAVPRPYQGTNAVFLDREVAFAGPEDAATDLNQNGILDDTYTQDFFLFDDGVSTQNITILNTNSSILDWALSTRTPWISFSTTRGTTTSESDYVSVSVDRSGLLAGEYIGGFVVDFGSTQRVVTVLMRVPSIAGDYRGAATTTRVNGKSISLGKVDLNFSLFMEGDSLKTNRFRGVIDRGAALLFPQDVFLDGVLYLGNNFSLTTTFEMAAGNRYEPPFETATNLFNYNPFPFPIYRQITLQGTRATADRLEGLYVESIAGVVPGNDRITIEGGFTLDRQTLAPTKRSIYNGRSRTIPLPLGGSASAALTNSLVVADAVSVQGVVVTVDTSYPRPEWLTLTLVGPGTSGSHVLVNRSSNLVSGATFVLTNFNGIIGQGEWRLVVDWNESTERGQFNGWELNLLGLATYSATGTLVTTNLPSGDREPVSGATLTLAGGNIIFQALTTADGAFSFPRLTENGYTLNISKPGFQERSVFFRIHRANADLGEVLLQPLGSTGTNLLALPSIGAAPLNVTFSPQISQEVLNSLGNNLTSKWTFGDGRDLELTGPPSIIEHTYAEGIHVTNALLVLTGSEGSLALSAPPIHVMSLAPNTNTAPHQIGVVSGQTNLHFVFGGAFIGSAAALASMPPSAEIGVFYPESKRDSAAFDIDRFPPSPVLDPLSTNAFSPLVGEDTAFFVQADTPYWQIITPNPPYPGGPLFTPYEPPVGSDGVARPERFRIVSTLGGTVFAQYPASAGNFLLQSGRVEP